MNDFLQQNFNMTVLHFFGVLFSSNVNFITFETYDKSGNVICNTFSTLALRFSKHVWNKKIIYHITKILILLPSKCNSYIN